MDNSELITRMATVEEKARTNTLRIESLEDRTQDLTTLTRLVEMQTDLGKEQQKQMQEQHNTLIEMNHSLKEMNTAYKNLDNRVGVIEQDKKESKKVTTDFVLKIVGGLVLAYLVIAFNLK